MKKKNFTGARPMMSGGQMQGPQTIDFRDSAPIYCQNPECDGVVFEIGQLLGTIPPTHPQNRAKKMIVANFPVAYCVKCFTPYLPPELEDRGKKK